ncbi:unnamed protein product [Caenorhabditis brenneri]
MGYIRIDGDYYDSIVVEKIEESFAKSDRTDAILVIGGKKLHVNKALLSYHSDYFKALFNSEFKEKSMEEINVKDVNFEYFATSLSLIHDKPLAITKPNAENLLKLADQFLLRGPKLHVERFIINDQNIGRHQKLILADKYNLENLLQHALGLYNSRAAFQDFFSSSKREFSDKLKVKMFDEFFDKYGKSL